MPVPLVFTAHGQIGDIPWMLKQDIYNNSLFIFGDRVELLESKAIGNGNAWARRFTMNNKQLSKPLAANVPIGSLKRGGYMTLTTPITSSIDRAMNKIIDLVNQYNYDEIYFAAYPDNKIDNENFVVGESVRTYITNAINSLG